LGNARSGAYGTWAKEEAHDGVSSSSLSSTRAVPRPTAATRSPVLGMARVNDRLVAGLRHGGSLQESSGRERGKNDG